MEMTSIDQHSTVRTLFRQFTVGSGDGQRLAEGPDTSHTQHAPAHADKGQRHSPAQQNRQTGDTDAPTIIGQLCKTNRVSERPPRPDIGPCSSRSRSADAARPFFFMSIRLSWPAGSAPKSVRLDLHQAKVSVPARTFIHPRL